MLEFRGMLLCAIDVEVMEQLCRARSVRIRIAHRGDVDDRAQLWQVVRANASVASEEVDEFTEYVIYDLW